MGLTATLIPNKNVYTLNPQQAGKEFRDKLDEKNNGLRAAPLPAPPAVDLTLRITNTTAKDLSISLGGDDSQIDLALEGPGAVTRQNQVAMTMDFKLGKPVKIAAGKSHDIRISSLAFGLRGISQHAYWTEPGNYTLTATLAYGSDDDRPGKVTSAPAKLKVEAAK